MQAPAEDHGSPSPTQRVHALRALFDRDATQAAAAPPVVLRTHAPVRRTRSEGQVRGGGAAPTPEVVMDATLGDRLWSALDGGSHRDSVSSSSSISSNDTVIDLSLPNLTARSPRPRPPVPAPPSAATAPSPLRTPYSAPPAGHQDTPRPVTKSKSNPNLRQEEAEPDELRPRPLSKEPRGPAPSLTQRRHTWSRLYMEGLKQAAAATATTRGTPRKPPPPQPAEMESAAGKSKSLGDLTSDDIACHFDSKYRSISRSFLCRPPPRDQRRLGPAARPRGGADDLAERLRRLTDVEPLTSSDFSPRASSSPGVPLRPGAEPPEAGEERQEQPPPQTLRRMSSRSQSRVRYIANRAKQAQERQRLQQGMLGRPAAGGPLEERGNPEGACSVARSPCSSLDLLSQLPPAPLPQNHENQNHENQTQNQTQNQNQLGPQDNGVFFMLKL